MKQMSKDERTESQPLETCSLFTHCNYIAHELANPLGAINILLPTRVRAKKLAICLKS